MHLFVSDAHLGRNGRTVDLETERALVACLRAHEQEVERLYLLGDVFDYYIEYKNVIPKGFVRLQGLLASWADAGVVITYIVGNHDPWHRRYFEDELGVSVVRESVTERLFGRTTFLAHGDLLARRGVLRRGLDRLLRHPVPVWLYQNVLPADLGIFLARSSSRALGSGAPDANPEVVSALRAYARKAMRDGNVDVVILAHAHQAELSRWDEGTYINTGCWYRERSFARMTEEGVEVCCWDGTRSIPLELSEPALQA